MQFDLDRLVTVGTDAMMVFTMIVLIFDLRASTSYPPTCRYFHSAFNPLKTKLVNDPNGSVISTTNGIYLHISF